MGQPEPPGRPVSAVWARIGVSRRCKALPIVAQVGAVHVLHLMLRSKVMGNTVGSVYLWQRCYQEALLETDRSRMSVRIIAAHAAIDARMGQIKNDGEASAEEQQAISDALAGLRVLTREIESN